MKTTEHVMKALESFIPEEAREKVSTAISSLLEKAVANIEAEYEQKLEEAYSELHKDKKKAEQIAEEGYAQAWDLICEYKDRLELQREELDRNLDSGFSEAYEMLQEERKKNDTLESELYKEFEDKLENIKTFIVNKMDKFLQLQGNKYEEMVRKDLLNDPLFAEHKKGVERMLEAASTILSDEDYRFASSSKMDRLVREVEELRGQMKIVESKNMRLSMENTKLNESVRHKDSLLTETVKFEKKARLEKAKKVEGRGALEIDRQVVIGEQNSAGEPVSRRKNRDERLVEDVAQNVTDYWNYLSGIDRKEEE